MQKLHTMRNIFLTEREVFSNDAAKKDRESTLHMRSCNIATEFVSAGLKAKNKNFKVTRGFRQTPTIYVPNIKDKDENHSDNLDDMC